MKILVVGASGMLGQALADTFSQFHSVIPAGRRELDIRDFDSCREAACRLRPDWIVNAAAYTHVDRAESESDEAFAVNAMGCRNLAVAAFDNGCRLLTYSSDYIFDGRAGRPYREWDAPGPLNVYGSSKLAGEKLVREHCPNHVIVRTSWLYGSGGSHFVDTIRDLAVSRNQLSIVQDQCGSPTSTRDLAAATLRLVADDRRGTYHLTNAGHCSWFEFAQWILRLTESRTEVRPVNTDASERPARRPLFSVLENYCWKLDGFEPLRPWQKALADFLGVPDCLRS